MDQLDTTSWHTYPKIYSLGHRAIRDLLTVDVVVEEKVDGSQFSFGRFDGVLRCRSKGAIIQPSEPPALFKKAVDHVAKLELRDGLTYRGEAVTSPKHNTQVHARTPAGFVILFDINDAHESWLDYDTKQAEASRLGLETVPLLYRGPGSGVTPTAMAEWLANESVLGGTKVEGFVVKQYGLRGPDGKVLLGKHVSERFKEIHGKLRKSDHPQGADILQRIVERFKTDARYGKAVHHLRDGGTLTETLSDIGPLIREVQVDVKAECEDEIKEILWAWAWPQVSRRISAGVPQWYKDSMAATQFTEEPKPCE